MPLTLALLVIFAVPVLAQEAIVIRAGTLIDGKGDMQRNATIVVEGSRIAQTGSATQPHVTYDFSRLTVLPGLIDTHVHIDAHFGKDGRASNQGFWVSATTARRVLD